MASETLQLELEALHFTYGGDAVAAREGRGGRWELAVTGLAPRGAQEEWERFVGASLHCEVPRDYPESLPAVELADVRGLSDGQVAECTALLQREAESLRGEMMLGHLCETLLDFLTAANHPSGDCAFCLGPIAEGSGAAAAAETDSSSSGGLSTGAAVNGSSGGAPSPAYSVVKLGCYHCFHIACFGPWWHWQQRQLAQREAQLVGEYKAMVGPKLREEQIERDAEGVYIVRCPTCRAAVPPASLAHAWGSLQGASADSWAAAGAGGGLGLDAEAARRLQQLQRRHAALRAAQQRAGGLIDASQGVAVSLAELQLAADTSRQAAAAAAAAAAAEAGGSQANESVPGGDPGRGHQPGHRGGGRSSGGHRGRSVGRGQGRGRGGGCTAPPGEAAPGPAAVDGSDAAAVCSTSAPGPPAGSRGGRPRRPADHRPYQNGHSEEQQQQQQRGGSGPGGGRGQGRHGGGGGGRGRGRGAQPASPGHLEKQQSGAKGGDLRQHHSGRGRGRMPLQQPRGE